jgi:hypothetical protein
MIYLYLHSSLTLYFKENERPHQRILVLWQFGGAAFKSPCGATLDALSSHGYPISSKLSDTLLHECGLVGRRNI